jgi:hypothetical protein
VATIVRRKRRPTPAPEEHPLYDLLNQLGHELQGGDLGAGHALDGVRDGDTDAIEDGLAMLEDTCGTVASLWEEIAEASAPPNNSQPWTARDLYARTAENRRVLILEAVARQIVELESCTTKHEFNESETKLREVRRATWGERPWRDATDAACFEQHVLDMVRAFTGRPAIYPNRSRQPLAVVIDARPGRVGKVRLEGEDES